MNVIKNKKALAMFLSFALLGSLLVGAPASLASANDYAQTFTNPYLMYDFELEVGARARVPMTTNFFAYSGSADTGVLTMAFDDGQNTRPYVTAIKPGVSSIAVGTTRGQATNLTYRVVDSTNITSYALNGGTEGAIKEKNGSLIIPITTTPADAAGKIAWTSYNTSVATVANGVITATADNGSAMVLGEFTDPWGLAHTIPYMVTVGSGNNGGFSGLLEQLSGWISIGESELKTEPSPYTQDSLAGLSEAVENGKKVLNSQNPSMGDINRAIGEIVDAINNLIFSDGGSGGDVYLYVPTEENPFVFEGLDESGNGFTPPVYIFNPGGTPGDANDREAYLADNGYYITENPRFSNIWKIILKDGSLQFAPAIWGGPDGKPGGGDDKSAVFLGGAYWVYVGQNIYRQIVGAFELGELTGGGDDFDPSTDPAKPVYNENGVYYIGPLGPGVDGVHYYYGSRTNNGTRLVLSTPYRLDDNDTIYYMGGNGLLTTVKP